VLLRENPNPLMNSFVAFLLSCNVS
jgi:hypothetical protein